MRAPCRTFAASGALRWTPVSVPALPRNDGVRGSSPRVGFGWEGGIVVVERFTLRSDSRREPPPGAWFRRQEEPEWNRLGRGRSRTTVRGSLLSAFLLSGSSGIPVGPSLTHGRLNTTTEGCPVDTEAAAVPLHASNSSPGPGIPGSRFPEPGDASRGEWRAPRHKPMPFCVPRTPYLQGRSSPRRPPRPTGTHEEPAFRPGNLARACDHRSPPGLRSSGVSPRACRGSRWSSTALD